MRNFTLQRTAGSHSLAAAARREPSGYATDTDGWPPIRKKGDAVDGRAEGESGLLLAVLVSSACSSYTVPRYGLSAENITGLRKLGAKVNVGRFTATTPAQTEIRCRASGPVKTPDGRPFEDYIRRALVDELKVAEMLSDSAPVTLTGHLDKIDFNSMAGDWTMHLTATSSNGRSLSVSSKYGFSTGPVFYVGGGGTAAAERACAETAQAFAPAVQVLIGKLVHHPEFAALLK